MITVSENAAKQIKQSVNGSTSNNPTLRIAATRNNDGSFSYKMGFDEPKDADECFVSHGVSLIVSVDSKLLLDGTELDFVELDDGAANFIFKNPNDPNYKPAEDAGEHHF